MEKVGLTRQEFLGMLIDSVTNAGHPVAFFGMLLIECGVSTEVLPFRTRPIYVHTYFIRHPTAKYATQKHYGNLTRVSPSRESLACETNYVL